MAHYPSPEMVAVAWAKTVGGDVDPTKVATSLPGDHTAWASTGFVVATTFPGAASAEVPLFAPVVSFDCWAAVPNSARAPWGQAGAMAAQLVWATYRRSFPSLPMLDGYQPVRLLGANAAGSPTRIPGDEAGFARVQVNISLAYTVTAAVPA